jgi:hypothetical protein
MARAVEKHRTRSQTGRAETKDVGSPISNQAYNVITALQAKLEGLEAYRKYAKDGDMELWRDLTRNELQLVGRLVAKLEARVESGELRMEPRETH